MRIRTILICLTLLVITTAVELSAIEITGVQVRASEGHSGAIISKPVTLTRPATIVRIDGPKEGFCIMGAATICSSSEIIGTTLAPGTYTVFPNVPTGKDREKVVIYLR
ncbi:MAG: hypothetical protein HQL03_09015 [Nitrospirae bacterium]|nr:hypothetical protein [Nitrospirota bacterium]MBF0592839.1 hypothetical protein [Nitrospirota bacterium]